MEAIIQSPSEFSKLIGLVASFDTTFNMKCSKREFIYFVWTVHDPLLYKCTYQ